MTQEFNNRAGRLHDVLSHLKEFGNNANHPIQHLIKKLNLTDNPEAVLTAIADLHVEFEQLIDEIEDRSELDPATEKYLEDMQTIGKSIGSITYTPTQAHFSCNISNEAITALKYISFVLPSEPTAKKTDLDSILELASRMKEIVHETEDFKGEFRRWLLELILIIENSVNRYKIRGSRGIKKQMASTIGELRLNFAEVKGKVEKKQPELWKYLNQGVLLLLNLSMTLANIQAITHETTEEAPIINVIMNERIEDHSANIEDQKDNLEK